MLMKAEIPLNWGSNREFVSNIHESNYQSWNISQFAYTHLLDYKFWKEHGNILVLVGATGFMAKELCEQQIQDTNDDNCSLTK